jgi:hypothetical protein
MLLDKSTLPCLVIAYRRIQGVQKIITDLYAMGIKRIYLAIDGPKNDSDSEIQQNMINWTKSFSSNSGLEIEILYQRRNLGVAIGVISAIDWFFSHSSFGVVIEDDLEISDDFLNFVLLAEDKLKSSENIWMISGDQFFPDENGMESAKYINYPLVWGWATSSAKWDEMKRSILSCKPYSFRMISSPVLSFWWSGARRVWDGSVDTWDIPLAFAMISQKKVTVTPPTNLVKNTGFDSNAAHTLTERFPLNLPIVSLGSPQVDLLNNVDQEQFRQNNRQLEKDVFGISWYNILSPLKYFLYFRKHSNTSLQENLTKLTR